MEVVIKHVRPLDKYILEAEFTSGEIRRYDCQRLIDEIPAFQVLIHDPEIFFHLQITSGGYGIAWNDELDVASEEIWDNGIAITLSEK